MENSVSNNYPYDLFIRHFTLPIQFKIKNQYDWEGEEYFSSEARIGESWEYARNYDDFLKSLRIEAETDIKNRFFLANSRRYFVHTINKEIEDVLSYFNLQYFENESKIELPKKNITFYFEDSFIEDNSYTLFYQDDMVRNCYNSIFNMVNCQYQNLKQFKTYFKNLNNGITQLRPARRAQIFTPKFEYTGSAFQESVFEELLSDLKILVDNQHKPIIAPQTTLAQLKFVFGIGEAAKMTWYSKGDVVTFTRKIKPLLVNNPIYTDWQTRIELRNNSWNNFHSISPTQNFEKIKNAIGRFTININA